MNEAGLGTQDPVDRCLRARRGGAGPDDVAGPRVEAATQIMDHRGTMTSAFAELGSRQMALAAGNNRYEAVGAALIVAFRQGLGPSFTPEARQAWIALFDYIDETMKADGNRPTEPSFAAAA